MNELHPGHYQITRKNHISHLIRIMPIISIIYGLQIMLMRGFSDDFVNESLFFTGLALISFLGYFYFYDQFQKTIISPEKIILEFHPFYEQRAVNIADIREIHIADPAGSFSTITLKLLSKDHIHLYFVDSPDQVATILENYRSALSKPFKMAS